MSGARRTASCVLALLAALTLQTPARASSIEVLVAMGQSAEREGRLDNAVTRYTEALTLDPTMDTAYVHLARTRRLLHQYEEALLVCDLLLRRYPNHTEGLLEKSRTLRLTQRGTEADALLMQVVRDNSKSSDDRLAATKALSAEYGARSQRPAQLALWRYLRFGAIGIQRETADYADSMIAALGLLSRDVDPVQNAPSSDRGLRRSLERFTGAR
jgi:tetratricopeptide (TPR) repeat protein